MTNVSYQGGRVHVVACCVLWSGDKAILQKRNGPPEPGSYGLPGGHIEGGETPEACLRRELMEELGVEVKDLRLLNVGSSFYPDCTVVMIVYEGKCVGTPKLMEPDRHSELLFADPKALPKNILQGDAGFIKAAAERYEVVSKR